MTGRRTFNLGLGLCAVLAAVDAAQRQEAYAPAGA
jgi:hypothetical protein